jgi:hypothetical protein
MTIHEAASEFDRSRVHAGLPAHRELREHRRFAHNGPGGYGRFYGNPDYPRRTGRYREDQSDGSHVRRGAHAGRHVSPRGSRPPAQHRDPQPRRGQHRSDKRDFIKANEILETTAPGVYTLGDVKGARPSRTSPRTTSASFAPTCWRVAAPPSRIPRSPTPCSQIRS